MLKRIKIIFVLILMISVMSLVSNSYSRYLSNSIGYVNLNIANWQILVNNSDITKNDSTEVSFTPTIFEDANVEPGVVAPSSKGYFDISIDPRNVDLSFLYNIEFKVLNDNIPDLMINKYAKLPYDFKDEKVSEDLIIDLNDNNVSEILRYNKDVEKFEFEPFTIRLYFEWYDGELQTASDASDTDVGYDAAVNDTTLNIEANIKFEQFMGD